MLLFLVDLYLYFFHSLFQILNSYFFFLFSSLYILFFSCSVFRFFIRSRLTFLPYYTFEFFLILSVYIAVFFLPLYSHSLCISSLCISYLHYLHYYIYSIIIPRNQCVFLMRRLLRYTCNPQLRVTSSTHHAEVLVDKNVSKW